MEYLICGVDCGIGNWRRNVSDCVVEEGQRRRKGEKIN